ncbi:alpha-ketoglutarate-dependent dioxygenase alkB homolog 7, mitochondrial [Strongylocentrotus purpuratus]|uniref:Alpha-ketoglutarate-dependent dioxygenase AlkB-like domain-containing protein n=1 Tax=Strongylocentrotus purpuratus TaxID=7668 RepID=A0A7M7HKI6_STRPU|nr:alpha-ketoglutarate-dependent dioxygenase alkB homolog 7, mitochondrial [Strongylocentrotus purpuratus]|eukprot:XP_011661956.1 PREDICTED: alpha-ketoglutarate-dependent dioxygenase alkB homolog 7, mitochondrial [Strongylocentrotus purpuratus]
MIGSRSFQAFNRGPTWSYTRQVRKGRLEALELVCQLGRSNHNGTTNSCSYLIHNKFFQSGPSSSPCLPSSSATSLQASASHLKLSTSSWQSSISPLQSTSPFQPSASQSSRLCSSSANSVSPSREPSRLLECSDEKTQEIAEKDFIVIQNFITEEEEDSLLKEAERFLKKVRYEYDHWDNAIHGFRETEKSRWSEVNSPIIQRIRDQAFPEGSAQLTLVHVLDLAQNGYIKPHVDSIKFCGSTIAGLSLLSPAVMRLVHEENSNQWVNALLSPRSLYIMRDKIRYDYTHEVLKEEESVFRGNPVTRGRRISIMCRAEVSQSSQQTDN